MMKIDELCKKLGADVITVGFSRNRSPEFMYDITIHRGDMCVVGFGPSIKKAVNDALAKLTLQKGVA